MNLVNTFIYRLNTIIQVIDLLLQFVLVNNAGLGRIVFLHDTVLFSGKSLFLIHKTVECCFIEPVHSIGKGFTAVLVKADRKTLDRIAEGNHSVQLVGDSVTLCGHGIYLLPAVFYLLLTLGDLILTDSRDTLLITADHALHKGNTAESCRKHTVGIFQLVSLSGQCFDFRSVAVYLVRLVCNFFIKGVDTALMMFRFGIQKRKKFSRLLNIVLIAMLLSLRLFSAKFFLCVYGRLVCCSFIVIILYGHWLPHFLLLTKTMIPAVTAVTTALVMIINFFIVRISFLFQFSQRSACP